MITVSILLDSVRKKFREFVSIISKYSCDFDIESDTAVLMQSLWWGYSVWISVSRFV